MIQDAAEMVRKLAGSYRSVSALIDLGVAENNILRPLLDEVLGRVIRLSAFDLVCFTQELVSNSKDLDAANLALTVLANRISGDDTEPTPTTPPVKSGEEQPMRCDIDADWSTYRCPCGQAFCNRFASSRLVFEWLKEHQPHTNGPILDHVTADGARYLQMPDSHRSFPSETISSS